MIDEPDGNMLSHVDVAVVLPHAVFAEHSLAAIGVQRLKVCWSALPLCGKGGVDADANIRMAPASVFLAMTIPPII